MIPQLLRSYRQGRQPLEGIPGPSTRSYFHFAKSMKQDPLGYMGQLMRDHGDIVQIPTPLILLVQVTDPELIGKVLVGTEKNNTRSIGYRRLQALLGEGLLTSSGEQWKIQRKLANPAFHHKKLADFFQTITAETQKMIDDWQVQLKKHPELDISQQMSRLTFTIIVKVLFSIDLSTQAEKVSEALAVLQEYANYLFYAISPLPLWVPTLSNMRAKKALQTLDQIVYQIIAEHKKAPDRYQDLLSAYLQAKDEETGQGMSDKLLRDEVITLMLAGHDTTASSISLCLYLLANHPEIQERLYQENQLVTQKLGLNDQSVQELNFQDQVFSETMRLYPAAWGLGRESTAEIRHQSYVFPKKTTFFLVQYLTHRNPRYWQDPDAFQPERFQAENVKQQQRFAYFPFGGGLHTCIGAGLARLESQIIISSLLQQFRFDPIPDHQFRIHPRISLTLNPGVKLRLSQR
ncbi:MAG: cytochrome P450 [Oligoflexus sp.]